MTTKRRISYSCPICAGSMIETEEMETERLSELSRLRGAIDHLVRALQLVATRPAQESAFIAAVNLKDAETWYGVKVKWPTTNDPA